MGVIFALNTPLIAFRHLLGKKSWNVYNPANVERVKRDEAEAAAREAAEEQLNQEIDSERRIRILRGLPVEDISAQAEEPQGEKRRARRDENNSQRKRRKLAGEDDTDRDIRYAKEDRELTLQRIEEAPLRKKTNVSLTDSNGHLNLFTFEARRNERSGNAEAAAEDAKKKKEYEDQYTMRFSNAGGFKQDVGKDPWYSAKPSRTEEQPETAVDKDAFGKDDPRRQVRDKRRIAADDPLAAMQKGVQGVRRAEKERREWKRERQREIEDIDREEKRQREERKRSRRYDDSDLDNFRLDNSGSRAERSSERYHRHRHKHGHRHSHQDGGSRDPKNAQIVDRDRHRHLRWQYEDEKEVPTPR